LTGVQRIGVDAAQLERFVHGKPVGVPFTGYCDLALAKPKFSWSIVRRCGSL
jgi:hypothetical protein